MGKWGEEIAANYLSGKGFEVLDLNVHTPYGEIDLIVKKGTEMVFVEVKTRTTDAYGMPETSVTQKKLKHLENSIHAYLQEHEEITGNWRIDVLSIRSTPAMDSCQIEWFQDVRH